MKRNLNSFTQTSPSSGEADPEVKLKSGENTYNVKVMMWLTGTNTDEKPEVKTVFRLIELRFIL